MRQAPAWLLKAKTSQGDCCTVNEGNGGIRVRKAGRCHSTETLKIPGQNWAGRYSSCNGKLLVVPQQRGDAVGSMLLMITLMLWKEQSMRGGDRKMSREQSEVERPSQDCHGGLGGQGWWPACSDMSKRTLFTSLLSVVETARL